MKPQRFEIRYERMMTEYDLMYILLAETKDDLLQRIDRWNKRSEEPEKEAA